MTGILEGDDTGTKSCTSQYLQNPIRNLQHFKQTLDYVSVCRSPFGSAAAACGDQSRAKDGKCILCQRTS